MTKAQILQEMHQMEAYLKERKLNLPEVIFLSDNGVQTANKRLRALQIQLDEQMALTVEQQAQEQKKIDASEVLLLSLLTKIRTVSDLMDTESAKLHHTHRGRFLEANSTLKQILR